MELRLEQRVPQRQLELVAVQQEQQELVAE
jgi:hypothetical protein